MQQDVTLTFAGEHEDFKGTLSTFMSPLDQVTLERTFVTGAVAS